MLGNTSSIIETFRPHSRSRSCPTAQPRAAFRWHRRGFTLLELLVVITVLGIATAIVAPRYGRSIARTRADAALERMLADIRRAQALARATSTALSLELRADETAYILPTTRTLDNALSPERVTLGDSPYFASALLCHLEGPLCALHIDAFGRIATTGSIELRVGEQVRWIGIVGGRAVERDPNDARVIGEHR